MLTMTRVSFRCLALAGLLTLAACQTPVPLSASAPADRAPAEPVASAPAPVVEVEAVDAASTSAPAPAAAAPEIHFYLAQSNPRDGFVAVPLTAETSLYALPQPVFTQADLSQVVPLQTQQGGVFLRFDFNTLGEQKLNALSQQAAGNYLILSINGQVVAVPQIAAQYSRPSVHVPMRSAQDAQAVVGLLQGQR